MIDAAMLVQYIVWWMVGLGLTIIVLVVKAMTEQTVPCEHCGQETRKW